MQHHNLHIHRRYPSFLLIFVHPEAISSIGRDLKQSIHLPALFARPAVVYWAYERESSITPPWKPWFRLVYSLKSCASCPYLVHPIRMRQSTQMMNWRFSSRSLFIIPMNMIRKSESSEVSRTWSSTSITNMKKRIISLTMLLWTSRSIWIWHLFSCIEFPFLLSI